MNESKERGLLRGVLGLVLMFASYIGLVWAGAVHSWPIGIVAGLLSLVAMLVYGVRDFWEYRPWAHGSESE